MDDVSDVIELFARSFTGSRPAGSYVDGRWTAGAPTAFTARGCFQPESGRKLRRAEEGQREEEVAPFWSLTELFNGDLLTIDGTVYQVQAVRNWSNLGNYWLAQLTKAETR